MLEAKCSELCKGAQLLAEQSGPWRRFVQSRGNELRIAERADGPNPHSSPHLGSSWYLSVKAFCNYPYVQSIFWSLQNSECDFERVLQANAQKNFLFRYNSTVLWTETWGAHGVKDQFCLKGMSILTMSIFMAKPGSYSVLVSFTLVEMEFLILLAFCNMWAFFFLFTIIIVV